MAALFCWLRAAPLAISRGLAHLYLALSARARAEPSSCQPAPCTTCPHTDYTIFDLNSSAERPEELARPFLHEFFSAICASLLPPGGGWHHLWHRLWSAHLSLTVDGRQGRGVGCGRAACYAVSRPVGDGVVCLA